MRSRDNIISHWVNRGPCQRPDGIFMSSTASSFTPMAAVEVSYQYDLFDLAHMIGVRRARGAGLLHSDLKRDWVIPQERRLIAMPTTPSA